MASAMCNLYMPVKISSTTKSGAVGTFPIRKHWSPKSRGGCLVSPLAIGGKKEDAVHVQRSNKEIPPLQQQQQQQRTREISPFGLWDPFSSSRTVRQMIDTMDRLLDDSVSYPSRSYGEPVRGGRSPWDIMEDEDEFRMRFDMPGIAKESVKISVEENMLIIKAEHHKDETEQKKWSARSYGKYNTRITLPENCQSDKIKAELKDGVLYITVPKAKYESKVININVQ